MTAVQQLMNDLKAREAKRPPTFPVAYIPTPKRTDKTANGLTQCIIDFVELHGWQAERVSIMGKPVQCADGSLKWTRSNMTVGTADIHATINGRSVKIEVKIGADKQSEEQRRYQQQIESAGGLYYIARNFEDFVNWYNETWANKQNT